MSSGFSVAFPRPRRRRSGIKRALLLIGVALLIVLVVAFVAAFHTAAVLLIAYLFGWSLGKSLAVWVLFLLAAAVLRGSRRQ